ncbi:MAG: hypothetical protein EXR62_05470 [Chloroflexi bacterium]|nr:hypothetical protein [Chloroflexota bacterium]
MNDQEQYASFFVRVWQEPREREEEQAELRGAIEHVQSGQKRYFKDSETLTTFINEVLQKWNVTGTERRYIA